MFAPDPNLRSVPATRERVVAVFSSLNRPHIALPGRAPQETKAYVVGAAIQPGIYRLYVFLLPMHSGEPLVYLDAARPYVDGPGYPPAEAEALAFAESMGFMMETLNFRRLPPEQQQELVQTLPCFARDPRAAAGALEPGLEIASGPKADRPRLARLLASF